MKYCGVCNDSRMVNASRAYIYFKRSRIPAHQPVLDIISLVMQIPDHKRARPLLEIRLQKVKMKELIV